MSPFSCLCRLKRQAPFLGAFLLRSDSTDADGTPDILAQNGDPDDTSSLQVSSLGAAGNNSLQPQAARSLVREPPIKSVSLHIDSDFLEGSPMEATTSVRPRQSNLGKFSSRGAETMGTLEEGEWQHHQRGKRQRDVDDYCEEEAAPLVMKRSTITAKVDAAKSGVSAKMVSDSNSGLEFRPVSNVRTQKTVPLTKLIN